MKGRAGQLVTVTAASGGLGATTLSCGLTVAAHRLGLACVVVDGSRRSAALQVTAGVEHAAGLRWGDLAQARGEFRGDRLLPVLPAVPDGPPVLSGAGLHFGPVPPTAMAREAVRALRSVRDLVVVDLPPHDLELLEGLKPRVLLLGGEEPAQLADLTQAVEQVASAGPDASALVMRGRSSHHDLHRELAADLGIPLLGTWGVDRRLQADRRRALPPGSSVQVRRLTASLLGWLADRPVEVP